MENIGDWLYLIFIGIAVVASIIKPKKNNKPSSPPPVAHDRDPWESTTPQQVGEVKTSSQQKPASWQEILQTLTEEIQQNQTKKTVQPEKIQTQQQTSSKKKTVKPFLSGESPKKKIPVSAITDKIKHFEEIDKKNKEETAASIHFNFDDMDEVKKGIIYAEIFNRRY